MTLSEAADALFDIRAIPDEFFVQEKGGPLRRDIILKHLSFRAGQQEEREHELPSVIWRKARIVDCLQEAQRIAGTARYTPEASE